MIVRIMSRHMEVTAPIKSYAEQKAGKLTKYYDRISEIEVVLDSGKDKTTKDKVRVEMIVHVEHTNTLIAHHNNGDAYACIDACVDKLERQLTDHKEQVRNHKHQQPTNGGR